jgi:vacuolar-type H+-ATPase subunit F/Vma7
VNKLVVVTGMDQLPGFRLAGVDAIGVDDPDALVRLINSWLYNKDEILLALDDGLYNQLPPDLVRRMHASDEMVLVTIPDGTISTDGQAASKRVYDMIRHATGQQIRFKGEKNGTAR